MRVYIAGPLREGGGGAFRAAEEAVRAMGHRVVWNPGRVRPAGRDRLGDMRVDLGVLTEARGGGPLVQAVVLLDGWMADDASRAVAAVARAVGIPAVPLREFEREGERCLSKTAW